MRRFIIAGLLAFFILLPMFSYVYMQGMVDGVVRYQHSKRFELTLKSMYMFGVNDACTIKGWCEAIIGNKK